MDDPIRCDPEEAMKYLCLVYVNEKKFEGFTEEDGNALIRESLAYDDVLRAGGHYITSNALDSVQSAATVRVENGAAVISDGPFAETKEHLGGFILVDARDLNDAIRLATKIPMARMGCIEVRPTIELNPN